jgi:alpha-pyrone synthase
MKSYISSIGIATPEYCFPQIDLSQFMAEAAEMNSEERKRLLALYRASGIQKRYSVIPDFGKIKGEYEFFPNTKDMEPFPSISQRMQLYEKKALPLAIKAIEDAFSKTSLKKEQITHIVTVSCTGMYAPGIDIEIIEQLGLSKNIERTCINYMGCYAAFNALKVANAICKANQEANVLVVCVELCTIHYQKHKNWDLILSNAIFGDGAAAAIIQGEKPDGTSLQLQSFFCDLASEGKKDMAWHITDNGFEMTLSSYVPQLIKKGINSLTKSLLHHINLDLQDIDYFAIHPGGKRILEVIEEELSIPKEKNSHAYHILKEYGNMSSATVLFVLHNIFQTLKKEDKRKNILSFAFGPGLTLESMLLEVAHHTTIPDKSAMNKSLYSYE